MDGNATYEPWDSAAEDELREPCGRELSRDLYRVAVPVAYGLIFLLGIVGNGLVVVVMGCQRKIKNMTDKYRLHLSVADLLLVLTLPFFAVDVASGRWYFGGFLCVAVHTIYTVNLYGSVLILAFISLDRYLAVVRATNSQATRKLLADRVIYLGVWLPALVLTLPDLIFARERVALERDSHVFFQEDVEDDGGAQDGNGGWPRMICERIYPQESSAVWVAVFRFQHILVGFVLPGLVILICYCFIITRLSRNAKGQPQKRKALKTTVILILCFFGCWLPYCLGIFVDTLIMLNVIPTSCDLDNGVQKWLSITEALAFFHCCLNPILYAFLGVKFKKSARSALTLGSKSSQKTLVAKKRGPISSVSESESSSVLSS
ncbi:unnamed protein product [Merluccius merluccius]